VVNSKSYIAQSQYGNIYQTCRHTMYIFINHNWEKSFTNEIVRLMSVVFNNVKYWYQSLIF